MQKKILKRVIPLFVMLLVFFINTPLAYAETGFTIWNDTIGFWPNGITVDSAGNVYVVDGQKYQINKFNYNGSLVKTWGSTGSGSGQFNQPSDIATDSTGNVYVVDRLNKRIQKFTSDGEFLATWGTSGTGAGQFLNPIGIAVDSTGSVYVSDTENDRIQKFTSAGVIITTWGTEGSLYNNFSCPNDIAVDSLGNVYVTDGGLKNEIQKFTSTGNFIKSWGNGELSEPSRIAVDSKNNVYVVDRNNQRIQKYDTNGGLIASWGAYGTGVGQFSYPNGIAVDSSGSVYVADGNNRIQVYPIAPTAATVAASSVTSTGVTLNGTVNPNNTSTTVTFDYGTSTSYGSSATATQSPVTGTSATSVSAALTGLTPNTLYHYRVKAVNTAGTAAYGLDSTFTTPKETPNLGTVSASAIYVGDTLSESKLYRTNTAVVGTFSWDTNAGFSSVASGSPTATYTFTPTDTTTYETITGQSIPLAVNTRKILSVATVSNITDKVYGTAQNSLGLPANVDVTVQGVGANETRTVPVIWGGYSTHSLYPQMFPGIIDLIATPELNNSGNLHASVTVILKPITVDDVSAKIKIGSTDGTALLKKLVTDQFAGNATIDVAATNASAWTGFPANYNTVTAGTQNITVNVKFTAGSTEASQNVDIRYDIVGPTSLVYKNKTIPAIDATNSNNADASTLLAYVNSKNALTAVWSDTEIGNAAMADSAPAYTALSPTYSATGTTYNFSQNYFGQPLTQSITVNQVKEATPVLTVDYDNETVNTTTAMVYSTETGVWHACDADMSINSWLDSMVAFKVPASGYKIDSEIVPIMFAAREAAPENLVATINDAKTEITVAGLTSSVAYEYSINGGTTYADLAATGKITVAAYQNSINIREKFLADTRVHSAAATLDVKYAMTFSTGTGSAVAPEYATSGVNVALPTVPSRSGYTFGGWYSEDNGTGSAIVFPYTMVGNITVYAKWAVVQASASSPTTTSTAVVEVNGQKQDAGTSNTQITGGQTTTTIKVDDTKLDKILESSGEKPTVTLPSSGSNATVGQLNGQTVKNMENKDATLEIKTSTVSYTLPASQINIDKVSEELGSQVALKDIKVSVMIAEPSADTVKVVQDTANKNSYLLVVKPVEFTITCTSGDRTVDVGKFNGYVERTVAIPDGVDPKKITTGVVLNADGTFRHVPTEIVVINGKYFAKINSLTNSTYSVIYNPVEFMDVANHWAKTAINDMGSRMVVTGNGSGSYNPDNNITRAEFATIAVRAMGLAQGTTQSSFADVTLPDWFNGYVDTATKYGLITGYSASSFGPNDTITREQAMAIIARVMNTTGLKVSLTDSEISTLLSTYTDGTVVSDYAKASVAACLKTGIVNGTSTTTISPKDYVTRAEVAVMVQRLLQKSNLI